MNDILNMQPGYDLNDLVAEKVMGWETSLSWGGLYWIHGFVSECEKTQWRPSTEISDAWKVVEKMKELNWWFVLSSEVDSWTAMFYWDLTQTEFEAKGTTAPEAICKAALLALEGNRGEG